MDQLACGDLALNGVEEADELLMSMTLHAASDHAACRHVQRRKQRGRAVPDVVMRHRAAAAALEGQSGLSAIERLDLAFLIHREHHGVRRRVDVETDDIAQLGREVRVVGQLELAQSVRLKARALARYAAPS